MRILAIGILALGVFGGPFETALSLDIGAADIDRALAIARGSDAERDRFHRRYIVPVGDPTVDRVEVITEFRRVVRFADERIRFGDRLYSARDAESMLGPWRRRVSIVAHLRFHPQNTYVTVPEYVLTLAGLAREPELRPLDIRRIPVSATQGPGGGSHLVGATVEGIFDATLLARATRRVIVRLESKDVAGATIDFAAIE